MWVTKEKKEIVLFETEDKSISLPVEIQDETVWLSVSQMAQLFDREESNIRRHILNVFKENEVDENNNVHFLHVNNVKKPVPFYSLDVIISVGYRVKSKRGVEFRRWANSVLKQYILQGYAVNQKRIQQLGEVIRLMKRTENDLDSKQVLSVIERYNTALDLLDAYDHRNIRRPKGNETIYVLSYDECVKLISNMRFGNESQFFGKERDDSFKAAIFLHFLNKNKALFDEGKKRIEDYTLVALTIMIAESHPNEKELMISVVMNCIQ